MIAKCIDNKSEEYPNFKGKSSQNKVRGLTKDKSYKVEQSKQYDDYFEVINDLGIKESYKKERFEVMEEKKVICTNNKEIEKAFTLNKEYKVKKQTDDEYLIYCDLGAEMWISKDRFYQSEYSVMELLDFAVGTKFKDEDSCLVEIQKVEGTLNEKKIIFSSSFEEGGLEITTIWKRMKFTKVEEPTPVREEKENRCYNEKCNQNDKNGKCQMKEQYYIDNCTSRDIEQPIPINYEEEYKKLKEENEDLKERLDNQAESIESYIKENEKYREAINDFNKCLGKSGDNNKKLKKELEELKNNFNKKQDQWENEQVKQVEVLIKESDMLKCQYEEAKKHIETLEKEKECLIKQIKDLVRQHNEDQSEKLRRQKENTDLKNTVKTLASML